MSFIKYPNRLVPDNLSLWAKESVTDELYAIAYNIEDALLLMGAEPGKDYTRLDLMRMANDYLSVDGRWRDMELSLPLKSGGEIV
ncbi:hypothetical protein [Microbulbifer discodermiae]|uniref:hypothetical protein n=1 Tax=Microbulbifer sp. 2201CG32-9 TaxID=3232309 RepID=UPI00345B8D9F